MHGTLLHPPRLPHGRGLHVCSVILGTVWPTLIRGQEAPLTDVAHLVNRAIGTDVIASGSGEGCSDGILVTGLPYANTRNSCSFADDFDEDCGEGSPGSPDVLYFYSSPFDVVANISLCASTFDTKLYIFEIGQNCNGMQTGMAVACNDDANRDCPGVRQSIIRGFRFEQHQYYYIVVDGDNGECGDFTLEIDYDFPPGGETCDDAIPILSLPHNEPGNLCDSEDDYDESCVVAGYTSVDVVYQYTPDQDIMVRAGAYDVSNAVGNCEEAALYVYEDACGSYESGEQLCCGGRSDGGDCPWIPSLALTAGHTYYFVVDRPKSNLQGCRPFRFELIEWAAEDCNDDGVAEACNITPLGMDCQGNHIPDECELDGNDANANGVPDECDPPAPVPIRTVPRANRVLDGLTVPGDVGGLSALRVELLDLQHPSPPNLACCPPPNFSGFEFGPSCTESAGCVRWVGPVILALESQDNPSHGGYRIARLQCSPYYNDWGAEPAFLIGGAEILPSSTYSIRRFDDSCAGIEDVCTATSLPITMSTQRWGDIAWAYGTSQPDAVDIVALLDKFQRNLGNKAFLQLQPNVPTPLGDLSALDIVACIDAFKGLAYPYSGPCTCPSAVTCDALPCNSDGACNGGLCVRTCISGPNIGEECRNDFHCGQCTTPGFGSPCSSNANCIGGACVTGVCGPGFCRDRCGRCE